jgi:hypothetical protein
MRYRVGSLGPDIEAHQQASRETSRMKEGSTQGAALVLPAKVATQNPRLTSEMGHSLPKSFVIALHNVWNGR